MVITPAEYIIDTYDTFLRDEAVREDLKPDLIIRFGAMPVSKALSFFLKENRFLLHKLLLMEEEDGEIHRLLSTDMVHCQETTIL